MASLFGIGISGLNAAQAGLLTTSHNISNANTDGYSRQAILQGTNTAQFTGGGFLGNGVHVSTVARQYNDFLEVQGRSTQALTSQMQRYATQIGSIDNLLADSSAGLSPAIDDFFAGVNDVAGAPSDPAARQSMLSAGSSLVARFKSLDGQLNAARSDVNSQINANVASINSLAKQIAGLNEKIITAASQGSGENQPNDLLDQRDAAVRDLNKLIRADVVKQSDGSYNVFIGSGLAIVARTDAYSLTVANDPEFATDKQVSLNTGTALLALRTRDLAGGELGGLLAFRDETLNPAQNALGRIAIGLAQSFNTQHQLGQDSNGAMGGQYFSVASPQVYANINNSAGASATATISDYSALTTSDYRLRYDGTNYIVNRMPEGTSQSFSSLPQNIDGVTFNATGMAAGDSFLVQPTRVGATQLQQLVTDSNKIAAASPVATVAALSNAGNAAISASTATALPLTGHNYSIAFAAGTPMTYTVTDTTASTVAATGNYSDGAAISFDNISVSINGAPAAGDSFSVGANANATGDNRNALALAKLQSQSVLGGATVQGAYAQLVATVGNKTREVSVTAEAQANMLSEVNNARESVSGVNLDEEAANLLRYQQAYQAAGKVIAIAGTLFDSILDIMR